MNTVKSGEWATLKRNHRKKKPDPRDTMLADFLRAKTPHEKREVIRTFTPHYFVFGETLNPNDPYKENDHEQQ